jgi:cytochrome c5
MRNAIIISSALCALVTAGPAAAADGKAVYDQACMACHAQGVAGAPKFGDAEAWGPRIEQGMETLYENSINGFQGETGVMPPKGGFANLSDEEVKAAVDYMVENAE